MGELEIIIAELRAFRDQRDWSQFHNAKDLALAISIEAGELNELFLWKRPEEAKRDKVKEELADVLSFAFLLADKYNFDIPSIIREKMALNNQKYPVEKAKGNAAKYTDL
jgi:NTP pyrophosphatase (non-canonical NTP hydrolase)